MKQVLGKVLPGAVAALALSLGATSAHAQLRSFAGYDANSLARNDDGSTGLVNLGFSADFFGSTFTQAFVNNNGNITFDSALATFTPFGLSGTNRAIIAPFFADVDTRGADSNLVTYGSGVLSGHNAFAVNWFNVGVFATLPIHNTFQLLLVDRSDTGSGNFDFEFNYTDINWETGTASGGNNQGLGGSPVRVGYSSGGATPTSFELAGSGVTLAFLDSNASTGLIHNQLGTPFDGANMDGRYAFSVRNGTVVVEPPSNGAVPEPSTYGIFAAISLLGLAIVRRSRKS